MASKVKRLSKWKSIWLKEKDVFGDSFSDYFVKHDEYIAKKTVETDRYKKLLNSSMESQA